MARPRGRPPLDANSPSTGLHLRMPSNLYDEAYQLAQRSRVSVPEVLRRALRVALKHADAKP